MSMELIPADSKDLLARSSALIQELARALEEKETELRITTGKLAEAKPAADAYYAITASAADVFDAKAAADILSRETGYRIGRVLLYRWMRQRGIMLPDDCRVYQEHVNAGHFLNGAVLKNERMRGYVHFTAAGLRYLRGRIVDDPGELEPVKHPRKYLGMATGE